MKILFFLLFLISFSSTIFAQKDCAITSDEARRIAEKFVSCSGYTADKLPPNICKGYEITCEDTVIPCKFIENKAFGYFPPRQNKMDNWTVVFRTMGKLKSNITGVKVTMNTVGKNVMIEQSKVFLKYVDKKY